MDATIYNEQSALPLDEGKVAAVVREFAAFYKLPHEEVIVHFVDKGKITDLHAEFFDDPTPTDCISFPIDDADTPGHRILGEIFVCPEVAIEYDRVNSYDETLLYTVHALLHLIGFDDIEESERGEMRSEEALILNQLRKKQLSLNL